MTATVNNLADATIEFTLGTPSGGTNYVLEITIPNEMKFSEPTTTLQGLSSNCIFGTISNGSTYSLAFNANKMTLSPFIATTPFIVSRPEGTTCRYLIKQLKAPASTRPVPSFIISTYRRDSILYPVDKISTGITFQATEQVMDATSISLSVSNTEVGKTAVSKKLNKFLARLLFFYKNR